MTLHTSADAPITCAYWDELCDEGGFLALGRNRYLCSYVVYTDGTYIYAENGTTGVLDYGEPNNRGGVTGTNAAAVIQACITALPSGGKIFIRKGDYTLTARIILTTGITLEGEFGGYNAAHYGTNLILGAGVNTNMFYDNADADVRMIILRNLRLDGNSDNQGVDADLIDFFTSAIHRLENLIVRDASQDGARSDRFIIRQ